MLLFFLNHFPNAFYHHKAIAQVVENTGAIPSEKLDVNDV